MVEAGRPGDPEQPNPEASGLAEIAGPGKRFEEGILAQVLGVSVIPGKAQADPKYVLLVTHKLVDTAYARCDHAHGSVMSYRGRPGGKNIPFFARRQPKKALIFGLNLIKMKAVLAAIG